MHRVDARAKALAVLAYTVAVVSVDPYNPAGLAPFAILPALWLWVGRVPPRFVLRQILLVSPFIACLALLNPVFDARPCELVAGGHTWHLRSGWVSASSILAKFFLTMAALLALSATTPFHRLLAGLGRMGLPRALVETLTFLHRYLFLLVDQTQRVKRSAAGRGLPRAGWSRRRKAASALVGTLFLRTLERAERVQAAMLGRGYHGSLPGLDHPRFGSADALFLAACLGYAVAGRIWAGSLA